MDKELREAKFQVARRLTLMIVLVAAVITSAVVGIAYIQRLNAASSQAEMTPLRELIIDAVRNTKVDAPVDPRTGDIYFPQARLYLPSTSSSYTQLTYAYNKDDGADLTIANKTALNQGIASMYSAQGFYELFAKLPYLQACQRGVTVAYQKKTDEPEKELRETITLNNGKTVYLYIDKACPELGETATLLKNLKAY